MIGQELYNMPTGRRVEEAKMSLHTLPRATPKALERARRTWPEARGEDFTREGRLFREKASGVAYRRVPGDPQLGGAGREDVSTFFVSVDETGDGVVYLVAADNPGSVVSTTIGVMEGRPALPHEALR
jgi:hypothetical protein